MNYKEFVEKYKLGVLRVHINKSHAIKLMDTNLLPKRYVYAHLFWSWIWLFSILLGIPVAIWGSTWIGIGIVIIGFLLPGAIKDSTTEFVLEHALESEEFYNTIIESGTIIVEDIVK